MPKPKMPSKEERATARKVLAAYKRQAYALAAKTEQERPTEWARGLEVWLDLLQGDPVATFDDYEAEYDASH